MLGVPGAHGGVQAVAGDHQVVRAGELVDVGSLGAEVDHDAELAATLVQDLEQPLAGEGGEAVPPLVIISPR